MPPPSLASRKYLSYNRYTPNGKSPGIKFHLPVLAVQDVNVSKKFYQDLLAQDVVLDLGKNITFSGGFSIQEDFERLTEQPPGSMLRSPKNMELYFETEDFDGFLKKLESYPEVKYIHYTIIHAWKQRVVRIYDPDGHMIEIGESMEEIARRYLRQGISVTEVARLIQHPVEFVQAVKDDLISAE